jgi:hypothetical protein
VGSDAIELEATIDSPFCQLFVIRHALLLGLNGRHGMLKCSVRGSQKDHVLRKGEDRCKSGIMAAITSTSTNIWGFRCVGKIIGRSLFYYQASYGVLFAYQVKLAFKPCTWKRETKCILHQELAENKMGSIGIEPFQVSHCPSLMTGHADHRGQTTFAVPLHCDSCVKDVTGALNHVEGIRGSFHTLYDHD